MSNIKRIGGTTNAVVVQLPERKYPGVVIQYDSIRNIFNLIKEAKRKLEEGDNVELTDILNEIEGLVSGYVKVLE